MTASLLAPFGLALSLLIGLPILAHLSKQRPREAHAFGAMLLLRRMMKRLRRRRRFKDVFLLLTRVLGLLALAAAASAPVLIFPGAIPEAGMSGRRVIVLDRSMSMRATSGRDTLLSMGRSAAIAAVRELPPGAQAAVVLFDDEAISVTDTLTGDHDRLVAALESVEPTYEGSNLRAGLHEARRLLGGEPGEVLLFTDESGPSVVPEAKPEIEALVELGSTIRPRPVQVDPPRNVAVTGAVYRSGVEGGTLSLRIRNVGPDPVEVPCEVTLPDGQQIPIFADLPPEGEAEERVTIPDEALGGVGEARCDDASLPADDARYFHLPRVGASRVLVVDGDPGDTPTRSEVYFLERALAPWGGLESGVTIDVVDPTGIGTLDPNVHRIVVLANVSDPRVFGPRLTEFVRRGGNLLIAAGDNVTADRYNAALGAVLPASLRKPRSLADRGEVGVALELPDVGAHPLFEPFSERGRRAFSKVRSHRIITLEAYEDREDEVQTLLRYEGGAAALVERRVGSGRVLLWTSTVDWGWSNLPLQSSFMPLMQGMVRYLGGDSGVRAARLDALVGAPMRVPLPDLTLDATVTGPDGALVRSRVDGTSLVFEPLEPGAYEVMVSGSTPIARIAANTEPLESDVRRGESVAAVEQALDPERFQVKEELARPLLWLGLLLLLLSAIFAWFQRGEDL